MDDSVFALVGVGDFRLLTEKDGNCGIWTIIEGGGK